MFREYAALEFHSLQSAMDVKLAGASPPAVTLDSPAMAVMTDFTQTPAASIEPGVRLDYANEYMRRRNVRSLIVIDGAGKVAGILTATDVLGEKPVKFALTSGLRHDEIKVADVMTPHEQLEAVALADVQASRVGHVVATLRRAARQHMLVHDLVAGGERVRGIFSLSQIGRQLGVRLDAPSFARTFAEIEAALSH